jgi:hypothetical protein
MTITLTREEAQSVLDALEQLDGWDTATQGDIVFDPSDEIEALRARLAQPEPEPVAVWELQEDGWDTIADRDWVESLPIGTKLYTAPPQREWQGLTDDEREQAIGWSVEHIEAKLKEKNHG